MTDTFTWPWHHTFPPFFTLQTHSATKKQQIELWCDLILSYCKHFHLQTIDVQEISKSPLFNNESTERKVSLEFILLLFEELKKRGNLEWLEPSKRCLLHSRSPAMWGEIIYKWIQERGMKNTVCTMYELNHGEDVQDTEFFELDDMVLVKALHSLQDEGKAELFPGQEGVKFF